MNSLKIYEIKDIQNIISNYQKQFEIINVLEKDFENKCFILKFNCFTGKEIKLEVDVSNRKLFITYDDVTINLQEFHKILGKYHQYVREAIYHYFTERIINKFYKLSFDDSFYYYTIKDILEFMFRDYVDCIFDKVHYYLINQYNFQYLETIQENHKMKCHLNKRNFLDEVISHMEDKHPYIIRDNSYELKNFFKKLKLNLNN